MLCPHLQAEKQRLLDCIFQIRNSGEVAPAYFFLGETTTTSVAGKTYYYARLIFQKRSEDKQQIKPLGRVGSERHRHWQKSIARRDAIVELEQQLKLLTALIDRQQENIGIVDRDFAESN